MTTRFGVAIAAGVLTIATAAAAQPAPVTLAAVQKYYAGTNQLTAQFRQTVTNATFQTKTTSDGTLRVAKPSLFRWDYVDKSGQPSKAFIYDGATLWVVDIAGKQIIKQPVQNSALPAAITFLTGTGSLAATFNVAQTTPTTLTLTPKQPSAQYAQIQLAVAPDGHVISSTVTDSAGNANTFEFVAPDTATAVKPSLFRVNPANLPTYKLITSPQTSGAGQPPRSGSPGPSPTP